jgi:hypothetical protein
LPVARLSLASETPEIGYYRTVIRGIMMRAHIVAASLALAAIGTAGGTVVDAGTDAQKSCRLLVDGSFHNDDEARSAGACEGMVETAMVFAPNMPADIRGCPPQQGSVLETAKVLLRYLDNNSARLQEPGITLAIEALRDAWPCDDAEAAGGPASKARKRAPKKPKQPTQQQQPAQQPQQQ